MFCPSIWTVSLTLLGTFHTIHSVTVRLYNSSVNNYVETTPSDAGALVQSPGVDKNEISIYIFGVDYTADGPITILVVSGLLAKNRTVFLLNWEKEANFGNVSLLNYPVEVLVIVDKVCKDFTQAISNLVAAGLDVTRIHAIGHSLGAQILGCIGRTLIKNGITLPRITGLDPAGPLYEGIVAAATPLKKGDADFVDIIHTDPGTYGIRTPTGDCDFYANCDKSVQPGCSNIVTDIIGLCSHFRAPELLVQALSTPTDLAASKTDSCRSWVAANGAPNNVAYIGDLTNKTCVGNHYLSTNGKSPYGKGLAGLKP